MAIIVKHIITGRKYILLGAGFGTYKTTRPSFLGGDLFPNEEEGAYKMMAVCDKKGLIQWFEVENLRVVKVNGINVDDIEELDEDLINESNDKYDLCPGCGIKVKADQKVCHDCGLTLISEMLDKI